MTWVRFHGELRQGEKRGLSRSTRFVYMELSHEARPRRGRIVLPLGLADVDAVHDMLGGNRKEIVEALKALAAGGDPMIRFEDDGDKRVLVVTQWDKWNPSRDDSTERVRKYRGKALPSQPETRDGNALHGVSVTPSNDHGSPASVRARTNLLSSVSSDLSLSDHERYVRVGDKITQELHAIASGATGARPVQDISGTWLKFCGHYADKIINVPGKWQQWCVNEAKREQAERGNRDVGVNNPSRKRLTPFARPTVAASSLPQDERSVATAGQTSSGTSGGASA